MVLLLCSIVLFPIVYGFVYAPLYCIRLFVALFMFRCTVSDCLWLCLCSIVLFPIVCRFVYVPLYCIRLFVQYVTTILVIRSHGLVIGSLELDNSFSRIAIRSLLLDNLFSRNSNSFPRIGQLVLSNCNSFPRIRQFVLSKWFVQFEGTNCNPRGRVVQFEGTSY